MEIWKDIKGYPNYQVSNLGNIKNIKLNRFIKGCLDKNGYLISILKGFSMKKTVKIHRLVALSFIPNTDNKPQVNHINGVKNDNRVENLEWNTAKENMNHAIKTRLKKAVIGEKSNFYNKKGSLNIKSRKIIDTKTNLVFNSIKEASDFSKINYNILCKNLNGQNLNKTSFRYFTPL